MKALIVSGLVEQRMSSGENIKREYQVTERGEMMFRFYANADTCTLVRTIIEKKKGFQQVSERPRSA